MEGIDDPVLAMVTLGCAFTELDDLPTRDDRTRLLVETRRRWRLGEEEADEMLSLARWLVAQCGSGQAAMGRVGRRLARIDDGTAWRDLQPFLQTLGEGQLSGTRQEALDDLQRKLTRAARA
ncbi:hypothetical protein [Jannaschia rubra]|uniref:Uncharacterized protein n=1 Tax=Jannaschia rubra TaxID=282197 RepID=A0A0M6XSY7_9RHOB|nr:hypothetical protein [Jannaschia rubra]CTQ33782.1 hypothetical protein JAN5088_02568 [Jannaschia rubra]SFG08904.1 hypothetical protein SAMN04488517_102618 [Jannaschia rubra]